MSMMTPFATRAWWPPVRLPNITRSPATLAAWAQLLGLDDAVELLNKTLVEEKKADELLTSIAAYGVNEAAAERPREAAE
jgi:ferritin-like metal-binding protein YciE